MSERDTDAEARRRAHYRVETELAARLRAAPADTRRRLYGSIYDELFRRVPDHPQLAPEAVQAAARIRAQQLRLLRRHLRPDTVFLELGTGDGRVAAAVAPHVAHVYAVDVSERPLQGVRLPDNVTFVLSNGVDVPVPPGTVTLAYSHQLMEHLHPDDALEQLRAIHTALAPGGRYVCITPNRLSGPHDVSRDFDACATGLHLKEYTCGELRRLFREVGFARARPWVGARGRARAVPAAAVETLERVLESLPAGWRRRVGRWTPIRLLLGVHLVGERHAR